MTKGPLYLSLWLSFATLLAVGQAWAQPDAGTPDADVAAAATSAPSAPAPASKPSAPSVEPPTSLDQYRLDIVVPELPAMVAIGSSTNKVTHPQTWRALATSLANGLAPDGSIQTGIGVEAAPFAFGNVQLDPAQVGSGYAPTLRSLRLSVSTVNKNTGATTRTLASAGLRWTWGYDPVEDKALRQCLASALTPVPDDSGPGSGPGVGKEIKNPGLARCRQIYSGFHSVSDGLEIASAVLGATDQGNKLADMGNPALSVWLAGQWVPTRPPGAHVDESAAQDDWPLVLRAGVRYDQALSGVIPTDATGTSKRGLAVDARAGLAGPLGDFYVEYSYQRSLTVATGSDKPAEHRAILGGDLKIGENLWLNGGIGVVDTTLAKAWRAMALANLKWGLGTSPTYR